MDYQEAKKQAKAAKPRENYLLVKVRYDIQLVFPYQDGIAFLAAMEHAQQLHTGYKEPPRITGAGSDIETTLLSADAFDRFKIAALLNVTLDDLKPYEQPATAT